MTAREAPSVDFSNVGVDTSAVSSNEGGCLVSQETLNVSCLVVEKSGISSLVDPVKTPSVVFSSIIAGVPGGEKD